LSRPSQSTELARDARCDIQVERTFENKVEKNAALKAQLEHALEIVMAEYALVAEKEKVRRHVASCQFGRACIQHCRAFGVGACGA
jgi:hypothetical protein